MKYLIYTKNKTYQEVSEKTYNSVGKLLKKFGLGYVASDVKPQDYTEDAQLLKKFTEELSDFYEGPSIPAHIELEPISWMSEDIPDWDYPSKK